MAGQKGDSPRSPPSPGLPCHHGQPRRGEREQILDRRHRLLGAYREACHRRPPSQIRHGSGKKASGGGRPGAALEHQGGTSPSHHRAELHLWIKPNPPPPRHRGWPGAERNTDESKTVRGASLIAEIFGSGRTPALRPSE
jgi:hypothetical protein